MTGYPWDKTYGSVTPHKPRKYEELDLNLQMQIQAAAKGCVSGTLREWPYLLRALSLMGCDVNGRTTAMKAKRICLEIIERSKQK